MLELWNSKSPAGATALTALAPKLQLGSAPVLEAPGFPMADDRAGRTWAKQSFEDKCVPKLELWNEGNCAYERLVLNDAVEQQGGVPFAA